MKPIRMSILMLALAFALLAPSVATARNTALKLDLDHLEKHADEVVEVTLSKPVLNLAARFLSEDDEDEAKAKAMIKDLDGIFVRVFSFEEEDMYSSKDVEQIRSQVKGWQKIVSVRSKSRENTEIYIEMDGEKVKGLTIISAEPKELVVINIDGAIDINQLSKLEGQFGIPEMDLETVDESERGKK